MPQPQRTAAAKEHLCRLLFAHSLALRLAFPTYGAFRAYSIRTGAYHRMVYPPRIFLS
jgi:hypothetical protein